MAAGAEGAGGALAGAAGVREGLDEGAAAGGWEGAGRAYAFYADGFGGALSAEELAEALPAAERLVRWLCAGASPADEAGALAYRRAVCAAADALAEYGEGPQAGFRIGSFSVSEREGGGADGREVAVAAALRELSGTGLSFCGAGR